LIRFKLEEKFGKIDNTKKPRKSLIEKISNFLSNIPSPYLKVNIDEDSYHDEVRGYENDKLNPEKILELSEDENSEPILKKKKIKKMFDFLIKIN
jgi:hypothetical protein